jgi:hypothetical protein
LAANSNAARLPHSMKPAILIFTAAIFAAPLHGEDAQPAPAPDINQLIVQLQAALRAAGANPESIREPAPVQAPQASAQPQRKPQYTSALRTGGLATGSLQASSSIGGRGTTGGAPRLTTEEWRMLFPAKDASR